MNLVFICSITQSIVDNRNMAKKVHYISLTYFNYFILAQEITLKLSRADHVIYAISRDVACPIIGRPCRGGAGGRLVPLPCPAAPHPLRFWDCSADPSDPYVCPLSHTPVCHSMFIVNELYSAKLHCFKGAQMSI